VLPHPSPCTLSASRVVFFMLSAGLGVVSAGCDADSKAVADAVEVPETYTFASRFEQGKSSVAYSGQTLRHMLIKAIHEEIAELTDKIDSGTFKPEPGDVRAILDSYYAFDSKVSGTLALPMVSKLPLLQTKFDDIATGKDLKSKFAGNGGDTDHADWKTAFRGFEGQKSAEGLLFALFDRLDALAVARAAGEYEVDAKTPVFVTADGIDLKEMIEKLLMAGVAYSQVADKYLDEELEGKDNSQVMGDGKVEPYSALEHAWDEGFGYFGASRDYGAYDDKQLAADDGGAHDLNKDGKVDVLSELSFAPALYAAKRDLASKDGTDFTGDLWDAFRTGRAILAQASDELTDEQESALLAQRDLAVDAFENVLAANVVHYLNQTLVDLGAVGTAEFELQELAEHFAELKAFSLGLQLNPRSRLAGEDFDTFHAHVRSKPVLPEEGAAAVKAYQAKLLEARDLLQKAYGFSDALVGDDTGKGGW